MCLEPECYFTSVMFNMLSSAGDAMRALRDIDAIWKVDEEQLRSIRQEALRQGATPAELEAIKERARTVIPAPLQLALSLLRWWHEYSGRVDMSGTPVFSPYLSKTVLNQTLLAIQGYISGIPLHAHAEVFRRRSNAYTK